MLGVAALDMLEHGELVLEHATTVFDGTALLHGFLSDLNFDKRNFKLCE